MIFKNLTLSVKIGLLMALIPLIAGIFDFFTVCRSGENFGEGCGFFLILISIPFFGLNQFIGIIISYPLKFIINEPAYVWYTSHIIATAFIYFLTGLLIGKVINKFKKTAAISTATK